MTHPLVVNRHHTEDFDVYVGRPSEWGNPYSHFKTGYTSVVPTREQAIQEYRGWLKRRINSEPDMIDKLAALYGKRLACWCAPQPCHAEILVRAAAWAHNLKYDDGA